MKPWKVGEYPKYAVTLREAERRHGIPRDLLARLMNYGAAAIAGTERNVLGALGLASLTPEVPPRYGFPALTADDARRDPFASIEIAARYLVDLREWFGTWHRAVLAYRWHPDFVVRMFKPEPGEVVPVIPGMIAEDVRKITADVRLP